MQHALDESSDKTKRALANIDTLYLREHKDGKHYIQVRAETSDGEKAGYLPFPFSKEQYALDFQEMCAKWLINQN